VEDKENQLSKSELDEALKRAVTRALETVDLFGRTKDFTGCKESNVNNRVIDMLRMNMYQMGVKDSVLSVASKHFDDSLVDVVMHKEGITLLYEGDPFEIFGIDIKLDNDNREISLEKLVETSSYISNVTLFTDYEEPFIIKQNINIGSS